MNKSIKDLVGYITNSIDILVSIKLNEELEKYKLDNDTGSEVAEYEKLLQKLERNIREHISIEHQLKIQCEKYADTLDNLEDERLVLLAQIVRYFFIIIYIMHKIIQDFERKEFEDQLEDLSKQVEDFIKEAKSFEQAKNKYKKELKEKDSEIEKKEKEISELKEKIEELNKNIKNMENQINAAEEKSKSINCSQEEITDYRKINCNLTQHNCSKKKNIRNIKNKFYGTNSSIHHKNKKFLLSKHLENKKIDTKKLLLRSMSSTNIDPNYPLANYKNSKQNMISNYNTKNKSIINENLSNYLYKVNESELNDVTYNNSHNHIINKKSKNDSFTKVDNQLKLKLPLNITNHNYNMNKNNVMINLSTNVVNGNFNIEKMKVQQKLVEYQKLIDKKIKKLMNNKKNNTINKIKRTKSIIDNDKHEGKKTSPKKNDIYKKVYNSSVNSEQSNNNINTNISNTNHKYLKNKIYQKIREKNVIIPNKINIHNNKRIINSNSQSNIKLKPNSINKLNIISKNQEATEKDKINDNINDEKKDDKEKSFEKTIQEEISLKGNDELKNEENKNNKI